LQTCAKRGGVVVRSGGLHAQTWPSISDWDARLFCTMARLQPRLTNPSVAPVNGLLIFSIQATPAAKGQSAGVKTEQHALSGKTAGRLHTHDHTFSIARAGLTFAFVDEGGPAGKTARAGKGCAGRQLPSVTHGEHSSISVTRRILAIVCAWRRGATNRPTQQALSESWAVGYSPHYGKPHY